MPDVVNTPLTEFSWRVANHVTAMLAYWDTNQVCRFANSAYMEWFGKSPEQMIGKMTMKELLGPLYVKNLPYILGALGGKKQVFEREIPLPAGGSRHSIATYFPDVQNGEVKGFFVHVADVTPIKLLEARVMELEREKKKEILKSIMDTQEEERESIATQLRDSASQTLVYCENLLQQNNSTAQGIDLLKVITDNIHLVVDQLNVLSAGLSSSVITHVGLLEGIRGHISGVQWKYKKNISFSCSNKKIEEINHRDKISLYRIVQDFFILAEPWIRTHKLSFSIDYDGELILLKFCCKSPPCNFPLRSREYIDIQNKVEYYGGEIFQQVEGDQQILQIKLAIKKQG